MEVLVTRVMERIGTEDPLKALPLIRQGVDAICGALRTRRNPFFDTLPGIIQQVKST
jgi:hypothetical protein